MAFRSNRKLISRDESKVTILQLIGFALMVVSIVYLLVNLWRDELNPQDISVNFMIIMVGFAFAFPSLLKGNEGLSTMRIVVFMMTNTICMLLLKIGWAPEVHSLEDIKLDQYWMGVIAFVFGAKATQSFFESKMAVNKVEAEQNTATSFAPVAGIEIITLAKDEKGRQWVNSFPYVTGLSVRNKIIEDAETKEAALIFKVSKKLEQLEFGSIPPFLNYTTNNGIAYRIRTDVIEEQAPRGSAMIKRKKPPFPLGNSISRKDNSATGSIGLLLEKSGDQTLYLLGCYHVLCAPELAEDRKRFSSTAGTAKVEVPSAEDDGTNFIGAVIEGRMNESNDFAVVKLNSGIQMDNGLSTLKVIPSKFGYVFGGNRGDRVRLCGRTSGSSSGFIKSHSASQTINYPDCNASQYMDRLIEVSKFSDGGDSGAVVLNDEDRIIGLLVADSPDFSYVLPVEDFILDNKYKLKT